MEKVQNFATRKDILLHVSSLREKIRSYKFIHVLINDKFTKSTVEFISKHFTVSEHCFVFIGGASQESFPLPVGDSIFSWPSPYCLAVSDSVSKVIFHGLFHYGVILYLYENPEIMKKSYWIPWGGDLYEAEDEPVGNHVRRNFQGYAGNVYIRKIYEQKFGKSKVVFPFSISYSSIAYDTIISTPIPQKDYVQIQVNNSTHFSTLEVFDSLKKFKDENIRVVTILSYGKQQWIDKILACGEKIFGNKFFPVVRYLPPDAYIKLLARNDVYILNQGRPQGMTTTFTSMLLGQKVFMRGEISEYLFEEGYTIYDTNKLSQLSFEQLLENPSKEKNKILASQRFDENFVRQCWKNIFEYEPK